MKTGKRKCLKCDDLFNSEGAHNRICHLCNTIINREYIDNRRIEYQRLDMEEADKKSLVNSLTDLAVQDYLKILTIFIAVLSIAACTTAPTSKDMLVACKSACRGSVQHFQDDAIDCVCKN